MRLVLPDTFPYRQAGSTVLVQIREGEGDGGRDLSEADWLLP